MPCSSDDNLCVAGSSLPSLTSSSDDKSWVDGSSDDDSTDFSLLNMAGISKGVPEEAAREPCRGSRSSSGSEVIQCTMYYVRKVLSPFSSPTPICQNKRVQTPCIRG